MPGAKRSKRTNPSENPSDSSKKSKTTSQSEASNPENKIGAGGAAPKPSSKYTTEPDFSNQRAIQNLVSTQNYDIKSGEIPTDYILVRRGLSCCLPGSFIGVDGCVQSVDSAGALASRDSHFRLVIKLFVQGDMG